MTARILIVDDDRSIREALAERLKLRFSVQQAASGREALEVARSGPDVVLLDLQMPHGDGLSVLRGLKAEGIETTVIVITAYGTIEKAVEAMREGAYDFLLKPFEPALLEETIRRALERSSLRLENFVLKQEARPRGFVVADPRMEAVVATARRAAASPSTVLVLGESGTGKEVLARQLHAWSPRASGPFIGVNCAALTETLLESELFGHERGAFTGATERMIGKFEAADQGTIFLDEIGEMALSTQAKFLRVLEGHPFERVGGNTAIKADVRVVSATNRPLEEAVRAGTFRRDLFFRLQVVQLDVPPLRDRATDIPLLAEHFLKRFARETGRKIRGFTPAALEKLQGYRWPGNVRELKNVIERAVALGSGPHLDTPDIWLSELEIGAPVLGSGAAPYRMESLEEMEKRHILETLKHTDWNKSQAATILGIERSTLDRKIKTYNLAK